MGGISAHDKHHHGVVAQHWPDSSLMHTPTQPQEPEKEHQGERAGAGLMSMRCRDKKWLPLILHPPRPLGEV